LVGTKCICRESDGFWLWHNPNDDKDYCRPCHRLCKRCYGDSQFECIECRNVEVPHLPKIYKNTCECEIGYFVDMLQNVKSKYCKKCDIFCISCEGSFDNCQTCIDNPGVNMVGTNCLCNTPKWFQYLNTTTNKIECVKCHPLCVDCNGPFPTQCDSCDSKIGAIQNAPRTCSCMSHHYYEANTVNCEICNGLCNNCYGPSNDQCYNCNTKIGFSVENVDNLCVADCELLDGYFTEGTQCKGIFIKIVLT